jgi:hypothetical protein
MSLNTYVRIVVMMGMLAVLCGTASAAMGIIAETQTTSAGNYPVCSSPCECISENEAGARWGSEGWERCSKSVCGQSGNAMTQYYCIHPIGGSTSAAVTTCQAPCECLSEGSAIAKWGTGGYSQCTKTTCGEEATNGGSVARYCFRQWGSSLVIGGSGTTPAATAAHTATVQQTVSVPLQTQVQTLVQTPASANPSPTYTWPSGPAPIQTKSPVGTATILAAIGIVLLAVVAMRKK